jgi:hypothetical protein
MPSANILLARYEYANASITRTRLIDQDHNTNVTKETYIHWYVLAPAIDSFLREGELY